MASYKHVRKRRQGCHLILNVLVIGMSGGFVRLGKIFSCVIVVAIENMDIDWMTNQHTENSAYP